VENKKSNYVSDGTLFIDCFPDVGSDDFKGNSTYFINDPAGLTERPRNHFWALLWSFTGQFGDPVLSNCFFVEIKYQNWPYVFVATLRNVKAGEELLLDYGEHFWFSRKSKTARFYSWLPFIRPRSS